MSEKNLKSTFAGVLGTVFITSISSVAVAESENPFIIKDLGTGYQQIAETEKATKEMACGEGKCGAQMMKNPEMKCGAGMKELQKQQEAQKQKAMEGKCAGMPQQNSEPPAPGTNAN